MKSVMELQSAKAAALKKVVLRKGQEEVRAPVQYLLIKVKIIRMESRGIADAQEEEHTGQSFLIPGKVLGDHAGSSQLIEIHQFPYFFIKLLGIHHRGIAVVHVNGHGTAGSALHSLTDGHQACPKGVKYIVLEGTEAALQPGMTGNGVADRAGLELAEF